MNNNYNEYPVQKNPSSDDYHRLLLRDEKQDLLDNVNSITCGRGSWGYDMGQGEVQVLWSCGLPKLNAEGRETERPCMHETEAQARACIHSQLKE